MTATFMAGQDASAVDACTLYDFDWNNMNKHDCALPKEGARTCKGGCRFEVSEKLE